jgi:hypothetical protein
VHTANEITNQRGEVVMTVKAMTLMRCRTVVADAGSAVAEAKID